MTTIREALHHARSRLLSGTPYLDAQILLCHVLDVEKSYLIAHDDRLLTTDELAQYDGLIQRRAQGEPVAYITGHRGFYDLDVLVAPAVLIPRPETEHLVEAALAWAKDRAALVAADIGTGSGAIAVTVAKHLPHARVHAVDISPDALDIARQNAARYAVSVQFHEGYLARPLIAAGIRVDLLLANLPYIRSDDMLTLEVSQYEPHLALDGGDDGLHLVRELLRQAPLVCNPGALILLEIGAEQGQAVLDFIPTALNPASMSVIPDYAGHDRIVRVQL